MIESVPAYVPVTFILTAVLTIGFLLFAVRSAASDTLAGKMVIAAAPFWFFFQAVLAVGGFYISPGGAFPRFPLFAPLPALLFGTYLVVFHQKDLIDRLPLRLLTMLHVVRLPVEIVLLWLYRDGLVPRVMTFEGRNFDILVGITAPFIAYFAFRQGEPKRRLLLIWNIVSAALLLNIVAHAALSLETPFRQFGFDRPNIAVLYFPYVWLPSLIVPVAAFAHAAVIIRLLKKPNP